MNIMMRVVKRHRDGTSTTFIIKGVVTTPETVDEATKQSIAATMFEMEYAMNNALPYRIHIEVTEG